MGDEPQIEQVNVRRASAVRAGVDPVKVDASRDPDASQEEIHKTNARGISWEEYIEDLDVLREQVAASGSVACVAGLPVDGVIPAVYIAEQLGIEYVQGPHLVIARNAGKVVLVVAGYVAEGDPELRLMHYIGDPKCKVAVLYAGARLPSEPDIVLYRVDQPVVFPYASRRGRKW